MSLTLLCDDGIDYGAGTSAGRDSRAGEESRVQHQVVWLAHSDAFLLWPKERRRLATAEYPHGKRQVQLRLWVPRSPGEACSDSAHRPLLPHNDTGSRWKTWRLSVWWADVNYLQYWLYVWMCTGILSGHAMKCFKYRLYRVSTTPGNPRNLLEFVWSFWKFCIKCRMIDHIGFQSW